MTQEQKQFLSFLAYLYVKFLKYDRALSILKVLMKQYPRDVKLLLLSSYTHFHTLNYRSSLREAEKAFDLAEKPEDRATACFLQSKSLWRLQKPDEARDALRQFLKLQSAFIKAARTSLSEQSDAAMQALM